MRNIFGYLKHIVLISFCLHLKYTVKKTNELPKAYTIPNNNSGHYRYNSLIIVLHIKKNFYFSILRKKFFLYGQFSLFAVVLFYKVAMNTEFVNPEPFLLGRYRVRVP